MNGGGSRQKFRDAPALVMLTICKASAIPNLMTFRPVISSSARSAGAGRRAIRCRLYLEEGGCRAARRMLRGTGRRLPRVGRVLPSVGRMRCGTGCLLRVTGRWLREKERLLRREGSLRRAVGRVGCCERRGGCESGRGVCVWSKWYDDLQRGDGVG